MNRRELEKALRQLRAELDKTPSVSDESRQLLTDLRDEIEEHLQRPGDTAVSEPSLDERLRASLIHFEGTHPGLTVAINRVIDALANMGI